MSMLELEIATKNAASNTVAKDDAMRNAIPTLKEFGFKMLRAGKAFTTFQSSTNANVHAVLDHSKGEWAIELADTRTTSRSSTSLRSALGIAG